MTLGRRQAALLAGSSALFFLVLYGLTVAPDVVGHDAGELQFVPYIFGIPHAPGYPLYLLVGKLWSLLPIGSVAFRMNLLSAVFGAAAVSLTAMCGLLLTGNTAAGLAAALAVGLAPLEWQWSGIAGIRSLTVAFVAATVLAALHWERRRSRSALVTLGLVCGFALDNHRTVIFLLPFLAAYVLLFDGQVLRKPAPLAASALALMAPLLLYGVIWLRAATGSPWDQYDAGSWQGFLNVALGGADSAAHLDLPWQQALGRWRLLPTALPGAFSPLLLALALVGLTHLIL
ncbi:MAG: DUF2723 domain-containing protein, partial [Chloroflexi bacterium]|nr:DUF2723 domain-containing protein [Chloroflexota bacterium]